MPVNSQDLNRLLTAAVTFPSDKMMATFLGTKSDSSRDGFVFPLHRCPDPHLDPVPAVEDYIRRTWATRQRHQVAQIH